MDNLGVSSLKVEGQLQSDAKNKEEILLDQFKFIFTTDDSDDMPDVKLNIQESISDTKIDPNGVEKLLSSLKPHKACRSDEYLTKCSKTAPKHLRRGFLFFFRSLWTLANSPRTGQTPMWPQF